MRTIICKKCGAQIDATLGECPNCGAMYYILPDEDKTLEWAMSLDTDPDATQVFGKKENPQVRGTTVHSASDLINADNDELFNARVWKANEDPDTTRAIQMPTSEKPKAPVPPVSRPAVQRPVRQDIPDSRRAAPSGRQPYDKAKEVRKKQLIVAAVALLAVLTLVLTIMGGAFNFGGGDNNNVMPPVLGLTKEAAKTLLENNYNLDVTTIDEESTEVEGTVIKQSIKDGKKIKKGDSVVLTIAKPKDVEETPNEELIEVPSLEGKTYEQAKKALEDLELKITTAEDEYSEEEAGKIIAQNPLKGAKIEKGDIVTVTISKGPEPSPSPTGHAITVTVGKGGSVSPKGVVNVEDGKDQTFAITPDDGYEIKEVKVDGTNIGAQSSYTFTKVTGDHTIYVVFKQKPIETSPTPTPPTTPTQTPVESPNVTIN